MYKSLFWLGFTILFLFMLNSWVMHVFFLQNTGIYFINLFITVGILICYLLLYFRSKRDIDYEILVGAIAVLNTVIIFGGGEYCLPDFFASFNIDNQCFWLSLSFEGVVFGLPIIVLAICLIELFFGKKFKKVAQCNS